MLNRLIALGLVLGLLTGLLASATGNGALLRIAELSAPFGQLFINAVRMVVIPLVVTVVFASVAGLGDMAKLGGLGGRMAAVYAVTLVPAVALGMGVTALGLRFAPDIDAPTLDAPTVPELRGVTDFLVSLVPSNPIGAAANGQLLPLIVFTLLLAAATGTLEAERRARMVQGAQDLSAALIKLVWWVLWLAPVGVFGLIAPATARLGWGLVQSLGLFIACVFVGLILLMVLVYIPLLAWRGMRAGRFARGTAGALGIAVSTTSTATAIPVSLEEARGLGVSETTRDLLVPLGASLYRPGSALFQGAAVVFLAHLYGLPLGMGAVIAVLFATVLVSLTVAPVPSSGVITLAPALAAIGVPVAGLALLLGIDRIPDMARSGVNVLGQIASAVLVDRDGP